MKIITILSITLAALLATTAVHADGEASFDFTDVAFKEFAKGVSQAFDIYIVVDDRLKDKSVSVKADNVKSEDAMKLLKQTAAQIDGMVVQELGRIIVQPGKEKLFWGKWLPRMERDSSDESVRDIKFRWFTPRARYYFDTGHDDDEIDIFNDGALAPTIDLISIYYPLDWEAFNWFKRDEWDFGPAFGLGFTAPAQDSDTVDMTGDPVEPASSAPVILLSLGLELNVPLGKIDESETDNNTISVEAGYALGFSTDESVSDADDGAVYVGIGYSWRQSK